MTCSQRTDLKSYELLSLSSTLVYTYPQTVQPDEPSIHYKLFSTHSTVWFYNLNLLAPRSKRPHVRKLRRLKHRIKVCFQVLHRIVLHRSVGAHDRDERIRRQRRQILWLSGHRALALERPKRSVVLEERRAVAFPSLAQRVGQPQSRIRRLPATVRAVKEREDGHFGDAVVDEAVCPRLGTGRVGSDG